MTATRTTLVVPALGLGDGLLTLPLARSLTAAGREVRVLHDFLPRLGDVVESGLALAPRPTRDAAWVAAFVGVDEAFVGHPRDPALAAARKVGLEDVMVSRKDDWDRRRPFLESLRRLGCAHFDVPWVGDAPGLRATCPDDSPARDAVVLHPYSSSESKDWHPERMLALGGALTTAGHRVVVLTAPDAEARWRDVAGKRLPVLAEPDLGAVANHLAGARLYVGPDTGMAHLASGLGVPTVSLFRRRSSSRVWRPVWSPSRVVLAPWRLPGARGDRGWAKRLSLRRVRAVVERALSS